MQTDDGHALRKVALCRAGFELFFVAPTLKSEIGYPVHRVSDLKFCSDRLYDVAG